MTTNSWILAALFLFSCSSTPRSDSLPSQEEVWVVGSDLDNYPFAAVDASGEPYGRDVEMMRQLARLCEARIEWRRMPFEELLTSVRENDVDLVCATMGITAERATVVAFTEPYLETSIVAVLRAGFGSGPTLAERLAGRPVHAGRGTTSELGVRAALPDALLVLERKDELSSGDLLLAGDVDALIMDGPAAATLVAENDGMLEIASEALAPEYYALVLSRHREDGLCERLNLALEAMRADGGMTKLDRRYDVQLSGPFRDFQF